MKKVVLSAVAALAVSAAAPAFAADVPVESTKAAPPPPPSPWDIAFGAAVMNDYVFRGVTQSAHKPSVAAYFEPRFNVIRTASFTPASPARASNSPTTRPPRSISTAACARPSVPWPSISAIWYYYYPGGSATAPARSALASDCMVRLDQRQRGQKGRELLRSLRQGAYTMDDWAFGPNFYYSPNFLNTGAEGEYLSGTVKYTAPAQHGAWSARRLVRFRRVRPSMVRHQRRVLRRDGVRSAASAFLSRLQYLERRPRLYLEGVHARPALHRHRSDQGDARRSPAIRRDANGTPTAINPVGRARTGAARASSPSSRPTSRSAA